MAMADHHAAMHAPAKLPVLNTVIDAFRDLAVHRREALRISAAWSALFAAVGLTAFAAIVGAQSTLAASPWITLAVIYLPPLVFFLFMISAAVGWHRLVLLGEQPRSLYLRFDGQVWRYIGAALAMGVVIWLITLLLAVPTIPAVLLLLGTDPTQWTVTGLVVTAMIGVMAYTVLVLAVSRIVIALPARAVGSGMRFREAVRATKGNSWRILAGSLLVAVPTVIVNAVMNLLLDLQVRMPGGDLNWTGIISFVALTAVALTLLVALSLVSIGFISRAYRFFTDRQMMKA